MSKLTAGILIGAGIAGVAAAAYVPVKVGDTVQQQIELTVAAANAQKNRGGIELKVLDYQKNAYSTELVTRFIVTDPALLNTDGTQPQLDIKHNISHGFTKAEFTSEIVVTESMQEDLKDLGGKVPLHFDGYISADESLLNTYIEGFTLTPNNQGSIKVSPGIIRLNYSADKAEYDLNGIWNGAELESSDTQFTLGKMNIKGSGHQLSDYLWSYTNSIGISQVDLNSDKIAIQSSSLSITDKFRIQSNTDEPDTVHYSGVWGLDKLHIEQYGQTLYDFEPSGFSYTLTGPSVEQTEALMKAAQEMNTEQMTPEDAQQLLPVVADVINAAQFSLHDINVVTDEGRINGDVSLSLDTNQQELMQAMSFPPILANYLNMESNASISKSLFNSMPVFSMMAMQLNQMGAYQEDEEDMLIHAKMQKGQLMINDVPMR